MEMSAEPVWAVILAGGDGTRLRPLTAHIVGDARPKQFCPLLDGETLLERTRRRVDLVVRFDRQIVVVSRPHEKYYGYLNRELLPGRLVAQPENRDTAPGILYSLLRLAALAGDVPAAIFPSDHYVSDDTVFMRHVSCAIDVVDMRPDRIVLLGIEPSYAETEYGWIEAGHRAVDSGHESVFPIRRFWEKPPGALAERLLAGRCLWNSFVMVGRVRAFLGLVQAAMPELVAAFEPVRRALGSCGEATALDRLYATLPSVSFSHRVLARASRHLLVMAVRGVEWSDWGSPGRVVASLRRVGREPPWLLAANGMLGVLQ